MTTQASDVFQQLEAQTSDPATMLESLVAHYRRERKPLELFEALKMQVRHRLGLPVVQGESETATPEEVDRQMELGLVAACEEVGTMMLQDGNVREGWMYMRPTGNTAKAAECIAKLEVTDENADDIVEVLLHEGVDVPRGFQIILDRQGTCNSITTFDQAIIAMPKPARQAAAAILLDHVYDELCDAVRTDIANRSAPAGPDDDLVTMLEGRDFLFEGGAYHLDTSHLASTVRFARVLNDPAQIRKAWELTQYGRRLSHQLQYPGDEPFVDLYPAHATFFGILMGERVDSSLAVFQRKARAINVAEQGTEPIEVYVDLLDRIGRPGEALQAAIDLVPEEVPSARLVPLLLDLAQRADQFEPVLEYCQKKGDALGYAAAKAIAASQQSEA